MFRTLDTDGNGFLDFKEFILANDLIAANSPANKLRWAFRMSVDPDPHRDPDPDPHPQQIINVIIIINCGTIIIYIIIIISIIRMRVWQVWNKGNIYFSYDADNSGSIDKTEMFFVLKSIHSMLEGNVRGKGANSTSSKVNWIIYSVSSSSPASSLSLLIHYNYHFHYHHHHHCHHRHHASPHHHCWKGSKSDLIL